MKEILNFAIELSQKAGKLLINKQSNTKLLNVIDENNKGLITEADILCNDFINNEIYKKYPNHTIISEEKEIKKGNIYEWIIDPLDGTNNFSRGSSIFTISIGFKIDGKINIGVVYAPALDELYFAQKGKGAFLRKNNENFKLKVSDYDSTDMFTFSFATGIDFHEAEKNDQIVSLIRLSNLFKNFRRRMYESTAYELCCVAKGEFDAHFNNFAQDWDIAAGECIIKEAGGIFTYLKQKNNHSPAIILIATVLFMKN